MSNVDKLTDELQKISDRIDEIERLVSYLRQKMATVGKFERLFFSDC